MCILLLCEQNNDLLGVFPGFFPVVSRQTMVPYSMVSFTYPLLSVVTITGTIVWGGEKGRYDVQYNTIKYNTVLRFTFSMVNYEVYFCRLRY